MTHPPAAGIRVGVVFPHTELSGDPAAVRDFCVTAEALGYSHVLAFDHVLGAHPSTPGFEGRYTSRTPFTEPLVLFAFMAGVTTTLEFVSGVVVLPQRQTALLAKQVADLSLLSRGRFRLGVGSGWNQLEYQALGVPFEERGARQEAQVKLLRRLWAEETVTVRDRWHQVPNVGISPRPLSCIPIWFGGNSDAVIRRIARIGDGWFPLARPGLDFEPMLQRLRDCIVAEGREPTEVGIEGFVNFQADDVDRSARQVTAWARAGATKVCLRTGPTVLPEPREGIGLAHHLNVMRRFADAAVLRPR